MDKLDNSPVSGNIKRLIREDELDKKKVAKEMGISGQEFDDMLSGNRIITAFNIAQLCMVLGVDANTLFE